MKEEKFVINCSGNRVNHPSYYNQGKIEVIEAIEDWRLGFCLGNAVKYIARAKYKDGGEHCTEDLEKAIWYIQRFIKSREAKNKS